MIEEDYWKLRAENDRRQIELAEAQAAREQYRIRQRQLLPWKILAGLAAVPLIVLFLAGLFAAVSS